MCSQMSSDSMGIKSTPFGTLPDGTPVELFSLANANGMTVAITSYGGAIVSIVAPDRLSQLADVVLGHDHLDGYLGQTSYFGALVGRCCNRIRNGRFTLDGQTYQLSRNEGANHLHGGANGFDKALWHARPWPSGKGAALTLEYSSKDGEEGYPGNLATQVTYTLTDANELVIEYSATTDKPTIVNLTSHSYFNLTGKGDILDYEIQINAERFTPVGDGLIPSGELRGVEGTPFDFRKPTRIGARIDVADDQLRFAQGYDHNFVLLRQSGGLTLAAEVYEPTHGRTLKVFTTEPGLQFYSGNQLDGSITGKAGQIYGRRAAFCLEAQHYPDSPNQPAFPSIVLRPGQTYRQTTVYQLGVRQS
jgi:aldose 1-epimerase